MTCWFRYLFFLLVGAAVTLAAGCGHDTEQSGVVASVNGRPVTFTQLEFHHDLRGMGLVATENPTVDRLRRDYGRIMADLIVRELVFEELDKAGLAVTDEEISRLEADIRADYPSEVFERMLFEENVDPDKWRESLANRIALEKFVDRLAAERIRVDVQEAADYYKEHVADFRRPAQVNFLLVRGPEKKLVEQALKERDSGRIFPREPGPDSASIQEVRIPRDMIPAAWRDMLAKLKPGQAGPVVQERQEALALVFLGETPAVTLEPAQAYPQVEKALLEQKRNAAFHQWLTAALASADIRVSAHLLPGGPAVSEAPSPDILEKAFPGVGDQEAGQASHLAETGIVAHDLADRLPPRTQQRQLAGAPSEKAPPPGALSPSGTAPEPARLVQDVIGPDDGPATPSETQPGVPPAAPAIPEAPAKDEARASVEPVPETSSLPAPGDRAAAPVPEQPEQAAQQAQPASQASSAADSAPQASSPPAAHGASASPGGPGEVEFTANKASWVIFTADDGKEERVYIKGGKTHTVSFTRKLAVRLGSPSDVTYRFKERQERVESSAREVKTLDFP